MFDKRSYLWMVILLTASVEPGHRLKASSSETAADRVDFARQVRPILSDKCFTCHGPDQAQRKAGLRLDLREGAFGTTETGSIAVVPGDLEASEMHWRITSEDDFDVMPPPETGKPLTEAERAILNRWIEQGAQWEEHWAFVKPNRPQVPTVAGAEDLGPIDAFVHRKLAQRGLQPAQEADKVTLIRRASLDLTGLPPTLDQVDAFLADERPDAYERLIDRLMQMPQYGEQMARHWLDVARYGDTHGLHLDNYREIWPYRDWVIAAFNDNQRFDRFVVEQLAGDLLPDPTRDQQIASGFNRCNVTTSEGGSIDAEYYVRYAIDRTETMGTAFLGLTVGCAVCHDHKYDPISQEEFYQLYAYFYSMADKAMDGNAPLPPPAIPVPSPEQEAELARLDREIAEVDREIATTLEQSQASYVDLGWDIDLEGPALERGDYPWVDDELPDGAQLQVAYGKQWPLVGRDEGPVYSGAFATRLQARGLQQHFFTGAKAPLIVGTDDRLYAYVYLDPQDPPEAVMLQFNDGSWDHRAVWGADKINFGKKGTPGRRHLGDLPEPGQWVRLSVDASHVGLKPGSKINGWAFTQFGGTAYYDAAGIVTMTPQAGRSAKFASLEAWRRWAARAKPAGLPKPVVQALAAEGDDRDEATRQTLLPYFLQFAHVDSDEWFAEWQHLRQRLTTRKAELTQQIPSTLVSREMAKPRPARILNRGEYDQPLEEVDRGIPAILPPLPEGTPANRLGLAHWLVDRDHPLTARVTVNRFWQRFFGTGLVATSEDFGSQGEPPSHPELLDWLAVEFIESGWDVQGLIRQIVTSRTYRQEVRVVSEAMTIDPANRLLWRGPRYRLDAEVVRDNALAISGLLVDRIGGPSVKPYQPAGLWKAVGYTSSNTANFARDAGSKLYRRSMYTFWKRTSPPPQMQILDAPTRETCTVRRERTNTPLQALTLMNETGFVEMARKFAERIVREGGSSVEDRAGFAFRTALARWPRPEELRILVDQYQMHIDRFRDRPGDAESLLSVGESARDESLDPGELAAWTLVANLILNLDETITKP